MNAYKIFDTPLKISDDVGKLQEEGIKTVISYYDYQSNPPGKYILSLEEAKLISGKGMQIVVVFEYGNSKSYFTHNQGYSDGKLAYQYASDVIGQPDGSAIYFAVDRDIPKPNLGNTVKGYFEGINKAFTDLGGANPNYIIGAYGSGSVLSYLNENELCKFRWLANAKGWSGYNEAIAGKDYEIRQIPIDESPPDLPYISNMDWNELNPDSIYIGSFNLRS